MPLLADRGAAALHARPLSDLSRLIHPVTPENFQRAHWEKKPLVVHRDDPGYYQELLTLDDVDKILTLYGIGLERVRVVVDGKETSIAALSRSARQNVLEALYERYRSGSTIVLNALEQRWEPLHRLGRMLGAELSARLQMNIYITPAGNQGFAPHYDMHDVFVAQVHGNKHWRIAGQPHELPLAGQPYDKAQPEPTPEQEFDMRAGDLLYLPRGTVHWATANDRTSVHITIGVHPLLYAQVIERAVHDLCAEDLRFRKGLPIGFAIDPNLQRQAADTLAELVEALSERLSPENMVAASVKKATSISLPTLRHHLADLDGIDQIAPNTRVRRRPELQFTLTVDDAAVRLDFHGKTVQLPAYIADEVRYLADDNVDGCSGASIPGDLDADSRVLLITTLLREGFLTRA
jgi:ribosomal protein L16 Arg81 hydroxylase